MRIKIYIMIFIIFTLAIGTSLFFVKKNLHFIAEEITNYVYNARTKEYKTILQDKKTLLNSFAEFISASPIVKEAYLKNDKEKLINFIKPLYKNLHSTIYLEEIHFFKPPATSFVNFANFKTFDYINKTRTDIKWVNTSCSPSTYFYITFHYPGLIATYPIRNKNKLLGSVSFGINIKVFHYLFKKLGVSDVSIYLNNEELKKMLIQKKYDFVQNTTSFKNWKVLGNSYNITLKSGVEIKNGNIFTKIEIKNIFNKTMAYLVIKDDIYPFLHKIIPRAILILSLELLSYIFIFLTVYLLFKWLLNKVKEMDQILYYIKTRQFDKIPEKTNQKDELNTYKNNLIDVANQIKAYINLLNKEVEEYSSKAYQDTLTQTLNRNFLEDKAHELFIKFSISKKPVGIIMFDIDNFKKINDTYGHTIGDMVLTKLAEIIKKEIRKEDLFIRYGGEEFLIILPNSNLQNTYKVAEKIRQQIENLEINIGEKHLKFTISVGISEIRDNDTSLFDAIKRADINLYKAKRNGKNRVEI